MFFLLVLLSSVIETMIVLTSSRFPRLRSLPSIDAISVCWVVLDHLSYPRASRFVCMVTTTAAAFVPLYQYLLVIGTLLDRDSFCVMVRRAFSLHGYGGKSRDVLETERPCFVLFCFVLLCFLASRPCPALCRRLATVVVITRLFEAL